MINGVFLSLSFLESILLSIAYVVCINVGSNYSIVFRPSRRCSIGLNIGGFIAPLIYSATILYNLFVSLNNDQLFVFTVRFTLILLLLTLLFYATSIYFPGHGIGLPVIPASLLVSTLTVISMWGLLGPGKCIPLSSVLGYLSVIIGVDLIKTSILGVRRRIEFILGGAGVLDVIVIVGSLTSIITLVLLKTVSIH